MMRETFEERAHTAGYVRVRLARGQEDCLARHHPHVVEHERAERSDVRRELAIDPQNKILDLYFRAMALPALVSLHKLLQLRSEQLLLGGHEGRKQILQRRAYLRIVRIRQARDVMKPICNRGWDESRKFRRVRQIVRDLGEREEPAQRLKVRQR